MWSKKYKNCVVCDKTASPHTAKGKCKLCYLKAYRDSPSNRNRIREQKTKWYWQYHDENLLKRKIAREETNFGGNRQAAIDRAKGRCDRCGRKKKLVVHHKDRSGRGKAVHNNDLSNLEAICRACHILEHRENQYRGGTRKIKRWSRKYDCCQHCYRTDIKHSAHGLCRTCVIRERRKKMT